MNDRSKPSFARRIRDARPHARKYELWDDAISGLGLCIRPSGTRTFFLRRNVRGRIRYATIGRTDDVTLAQARREARGLIVTFLGTARKDNGPRTPGHPMDAFAAEFLERQACHWKPAALETSKAAIRNHILPAFGHLTVDAFTRERVQDWFASMSGTPDNANRVMPVLSVMMRMAELWEYRVHNTNPCKVRVRPSRYGRRVQPTDPLAQRAFTTSACPVRTGLAEPLPCKNTRRFKMEPKARILPAFGRMRIDEIGPVEVAAWFDAASRDRPGAANRALEILRAMMFKAEEWGWRERDANPCLGIRKNPRRKVARFLDTDELDRLGRALDAREAEWPDAVAAIRLLALTGCRRGEVLDLQWRDIGTEAIRLPDSKTGPRSVPLGEGAKALLDALPGERCADAFLFPRYAQGRGQFRFAARWRAICGGAGLGRLRCTTSVTPMPAMPSCPARTCHWSASCSATGGTAPPPVTPTSPTDTSSKRPRRWERSLRWQ